METKFHRPENAPEYLREKHGIKIAPQTLARMRVDGSGPVFQKNGRAVLYTDAALDAWAEGRLSAPVRSTSELPKTKKAA